MTETAMNKVYFRFNFTTSDIASKTVLVYNLFPAQASDFEKHLVEKSILFFEFFCTLLLTTFLHPSKW